MTLRKTETQNLWGKTRKESKMNLLIPHDAADNNCFMCLICPYTEQDIIHSHDSSQGKLHNLSANLYVNWPITAGVVVPTNLNHYSPQLAGKEKGMRLSGVFVSLNKNA
jgi:hypothetical protein